VIAAASSCDQSLWFAFICNSIQNHDQSGLVGPLVEHVLDAVAIFIVLYLVGRLTRLLVLWAMRRAKADRQVRTLVRNLITVTTYVVAVISALVVYGVNVAVILTAAGLGTVAIGLAFQDLLRNVLAGIWLLLEQPFRLGDIITVMDQTGAVQNITLRTTTLRTGVGELAILPNLTVFTGIVINMTHFDTRRLSVGVRIPVDADLAELMRSARAAVEAIPGIESKPAIVFEPTLDREVPLLRCHFWVDQRERDPDAMTAVVAERLWDVVGAKPEAAPDTPDSVRKRPGKVAPRGG
jgi:small-conductance mechanosensitive channel